MPEIISKMIQVFNMAVFIDGATDGALLSKFQHHRAMIRMHRVGHNGNA